MNNQMDRLLVFFTEEVGCFVSFSFEYISYVYSDDASQTNNKVDEEIQIALNAGYCPSVYMNTEDGQNWSDERHNKVKSANCLQWW